MQKKKGVMQKIKGSCKKKKCKVKKKSVVQKKKVSCKKKKCRAKKKCLYIGRAKKIFCFAGYLLISKFFNF
jgi:hypothetical protein